MRFLIPLFIILIAVFPIPAQQTLEPNLETIIRRASEESLKYLETFKNLIANEKKTVEILRENGSVKRTRTIESNFIAYQLSKNAGRIVEYRNITAVDGKRIADADSRAEAFFERLAKAETSADELERIRKESFRYDDDIEVDGATLFQGIPLYKNPSDVIRFEISGSDFIDNNEVIIIKYQQTKQSPSVRLAKSGDLDKEPTAVSVDDGENLKGSQNERLRGTLWLDSKTHQIRREVREFTIQPEGHSEPVVISKDDFHYRDSEFGILTPSRIQTVFYKLLRKKKSSFAEIRVVLEYTKFTNPDVEVKSAEIK